MSGLIGLSDGWLNAAALLRRLPVHYSGMIEKLKLKN